VHYIDHESGASQYRGGKKGKKGEKKGKKSKKKSKKQEKEKEMIRIVRTKGLISEGIKKSSPGEI
jgi:hypothetical protein